MTEATQALLAGTQAARDALDLRMIPIGDIAADPGQPRKTFDAAKLDELAASLKQGQTNPIRVRPRGAAETFPPEIKWILVHGERRLWAATKAEIPRLRAEVAWSIGADDASTVLLEQIADNLQHEDLSTVEQAAGIRRYAELTKLGTRAIATKLGKKESYVSFALGMKKMPAALVKRIEQNARGTPDVEPYELTWKHLRHLLRLTDYPEELARAYDDAFMDRSAAREVERAVTWTLEEIERECVRVEQRRKQEVAAAKAKAEGKPAAAPSMPSPMSHLSEKAKREALQAARMTRVRKDLIRGAVSGIVEQVAAIAKTIRLPEGLALSVAGRVSGYDLTRSGAAAMKYLENIASIVVPELPGKWSKVKLGSATNAGRWAKDDEAGRQWLAFAYWLATETKGMDADLDRQSKDVLKARDAKIKEATKPIKRESSRGMIQPSRRSPSDKPEMKKCAKDGCATMFAIYKKPGRHPKYCAKHRSR